MESRPIEVAAIVKAVLPGAMFQVELESGRRVVAHVAQDFRIHSTRILPGDRVTLHLARHDLTRGRIVCRV